MQRVVLIVAPAGYGKSVALRQYLDTAAEPYVRYDVHAEHASLLGFIRGFADALLEVAPDLRKTVSGAYEKSRTSRTPGADLAMWMHAHLKTFTGTLAVDDLHVTENDPEITKFLVGLIERTRGRARWILASRSSLDLPVGSWLAYGEMDLTIDEEDLKFDAQEARLAAKASRVRVRDEELDEILAMTQGWPTALSFALRSSTRSIDLRNIAANTREMVYRYLAEQVYHSLDESEREFLHFAATLPEIDLEVLRHAGYERGKALVESLRDRVAFIYPDRPGVYRCHDLFRDFLHHELELTGDQALKSVQQRVARALEAAGRIAAALALYAAAGASADVLRLLEEHGFELMEQAHADAVDAAIDSLPQDVRATNGVVLGMRALGEADTGRLDRAESLFERAIARTQNRRLVAALATRHAQLQINRRKHPAATLEPLLREEIGESLLGEIFALLAGAYAYLGPPEAADEYIEHARRIAASISVDSVRAKIYQRLGFSFAHLGRTEEARNYQTMAAELAIENGLFSLASRAYGILSNVALDEDDGPRVIWFAQQSAAAGAKSGDRLSIQTAILQMINVEIRRGNWERVRALQEQVAPFAITDSMRSAAVSVTDAMLAASEGHFDDAYRTLLPIVERAAFERDRILDGALLALFAVASNQRTEALELVVNILDRSEKLRIATNSDRMKTQLSRYICAIAEALGGRSTAASRILQQKDSLHPAAVAMRDLALAVLRALKTRAGVDDMREPLTTLQSLGFGGYGRFVELAWRVNAELGAENAVLTRSEIAILSLLAEGKSPKEIAAERSRSVYTIQAHIQNAIAKLGCRGRSEALVAARKRGLLG